MAEIKCPKCGEVFTVDEAGYAAILQQVRTDEFQKELRGRLEEEKRHWEEKQAAEKESEIGKAVSEKEKEISKLREEITKLNAEAKNSDTEKNLAVNDAVSKTQSDYEEKLKAAEEETRQLKQKIALDAQQHESKLKESAAEKDKEIAELNHKIEISESEHQLALNEMQSNADKKFKEAETAHKVILAQKDAEIDQLNKNRPHSTKDIGEDLEQYCLNEFNLHLAPTVPNASFKKDNDAKRGSKGDFIYREYDENGIEFISIMFEMKNKSEESKTTQKNDKFFEKLDKDRKEKECEYAILVSRLEEGTKNSVYDQGIYEVPRSTYGFEKMYVIRPWFFIQMIRLLRNMALDSLKVKRELKLAQDQNNDMTHFRENLAEISKGIHENYRSAGEYFRNAIKKIDKSISFLEDTKKALKSFEDELLQARNKADGLTVENLTKEIPALIEMFKALPDQNKT